MNLGKPNRIDVDAVAARNPRIRAGWFKRWLQKMDRAEQLGLATPDTVDAQRQEPPTSVWRVPPQRSRRPKGNRPGQGIPFVPHWAIGDRANRPRRK